MLDKPKTNCVYATWPQHRFKLCGFKFMIESIIGQAKAKSTSL